MYEARLREAVDRKLFAIPIRWAVSGVQSDESLDAAVGDARTIAAFRPIPGVKRATKKQLRRGGGARELFEVYGGLGSGKVVVVGEPGAGKTGMGILLTLEALERRKALPDSDRSRVPVPLLFSVHGWTPREWPLRDWVASRLTTEHRDIFVGSRGRREAASLVVEPYISLILDGFDEMSLQSRIDAVQALARSEFRIVILSRKDELVEATRTTSLAGTIVMELDGVSPTDASLFLQSSETDPRRYRALLDNLAARPEEHRRSGTVQPIGARPRA